MIAVVDYGGGNLGSLTGALERFGVGFALTDEPAAVDLADAVILPGDGAFGATMEALRARGLDDAVRRAIAAGRPFLGICVGMQILFEGSDEYGEHRGFGVFPGTVTRLSGAPRVPHMGWDTLDVVGAHPCIEGVRTGDYVYFLHSYAAPVVADTVASCTYGRPFSAVVARGRVVGTQFHPEKSQQTGLRILSNFLRSIDAGARA
ncbi:MAG TPA: imidazole glycerol phosphate synthase subunit HisH [Candidatus Dormibacteraeota bacterium]|nr:imidazole glycerol phosphate synthase subunit HisH [Candidatus Dormibacteraeota bacterium]